MIKVLNISICKQNKQLNVLLNSALLLESFVSHLCPRYPKREREKRQWKSEGKLEIINIKIISFELIYNQFALHYVACRFVFEFSSSSKCTAVLVVAAVVELQ